MSFFEVLTALAFAAFADAPVDVAVVEVGMGGAWDATNVADGAGGRGRPRSASTTPTTSATPSPTSPARRPGSSSRPRPPCWPRRSPRRPDVLVAARCRWRRRGRARAWSSACSERQVAVGGQLLTLHGLGGDYDEVFLPLFGAHQARNAALALAAVEAFFAVRGPRRAAVLDADVVRAGVRRGDLAGSARGGPPLPTVVVDAAHNPHGAVALAEAVLDSFAFTRVVGVVGVLADKDAAGILSALEPVVDEVVVTRSSSPRAVPVQDLAEIARDVLGENRVTAVERLDEALERAIELAEVGAPAGVGAGVLVTGSVTVAGEARLLLGAESGQSEGSTRAEHTGPRGWLRDQYDDESDR